MTNGGDVQKATKQPNAEACIFRCEATAHCCVGLWNSANNMCYLKSVGKVIGGGWHATAFNCTGCSAAIPTPPPTPSPPTPKPAPTPSPPPTPAAEFFNMSSMVGAMYTPWRAGNQFWWHKYSQYRADVVNEVSSMHKVLGFTTIRVFLHDMLWDDDSAGLLSNMDDFLGILHAQGMRAGFVFFDDCWQHSNASVDNHCQPIQGLHNGCWFAGPQDEKRNSGVGQFKPYVSGVVSKFRSDPRVAWWEIFNEPHKGDKFSISLRDAAFGWAMESGPTAPVISCWDDNNDTQVVDTHEYSVPNDRSPALENPKKGGVVTEAGARFFQGTHDYGTH